MDRRNRPRVQALWQELDQSGMSSLFSIDQCTKVPYSGRATLIMSHVPTQKGGAWNELTVKKKHRIMEIGMENGLPLISLVQSVRALQAKAYLNADIDLGRRILTTTIRRLSLHW